MLTLNRIIVAGFACLCVSVLALPSFADGERLQCIPTITTCPATQPALDVGPDCTVTVPDIIDQAGIVWACPETIHEIEQSPAAGTTYTAGGDYLWITLRARECHDKGGKRAPDGQDCEPWTSCSVQVPLNYPITCPETPQTLTADSSCMAVVPDLTGDVSAPSCCIEARSECCGETRVTQTPEAGTEIGLGTTEVSLVVERCLPSYCCDRGTNRGSEEDECFCGQELGHVVPVVDSVGLDLGAKRREPD